MSDPTSIEEMNVRFMRCTKCHEADATKRWLLAGACHAVPALRVPRREWFPPRGWAGSATPPPRAVMFLATNPGHPLPQEVALWTGAPETPSRASQLSTAHANAELELCASLYRDGARGRTKFHTNSVQVARSLLWLVARTGERLHDAWFDNVWFSDVVKCSTARETGSPGIEDLARACRHLLEQELRFLKPKLVVTLGSSASRALAATQLAVPSLPVPHPAGRGWRAIKSAESDPWLRDACGLLGLDWSRESAPLQDVRERLHAEPWG